MKMVERFRAVLNFFWLGLNTCVCSFFFYIILLLQTIVQRLGIQNHGQLALTWIAEKWIQGNAWFITKTNHLRIPQLSFLSTYKNKSYLVISNHKSWVDIFILQWTLKDKIPFLRFFIKDNLKWIPLLGGAWKALGFPFMKRFSKQELLKKPWLRGQDLKETQRSCQRLKGLPSSLLIFLEGTRSTTKKIAKEKLFHHLLKPKTSGLATALDCLGKDVECIVDVTLVYQDKPTFLNFLAGRLKNFQVMARTIQIPEKFRNQQIMSNPVLRQEFDRWIFSIWKEKDLWMTQQLSNNISAY
jgi:1-acyl-sn-glycerol-3-phosphate acyltransferase